MLFINCSQTEPFDNNFYATEDVNIRATLKCVIQHNTPHLKISNTQAFDTNYPRIILTTKKKTQNGTLYFK